MVFKFIMYVMMQMKVSIIRIAIIITIIIISISIIISGMLLMPSCRLLVKRRHRCKSLPVKSSR